MKLQKKVRPNLIAALGTCFPILTQFDLKQLLKPLPARFRKRVNMPVDHR